MQENVHSRYTVVELQARVDELEKLVKLLQEQNRLLLHRQFAAKSEAHSLDQLPLFNLSQETSPLENDLNQNKITVLSHHRKRQQRITFSDDLPKRRIEIDLGDHEKQCECCQTPLTQIGEDITRKLEYIPAKVEIIEYARLKYACKACEETIKRPSLPNFILPKSYATPSLLAHIIVSKFDDSLPLNRIEQQFKRQGIHLPVSTMSDLLIKIASQLEPIYHIMTEKMLSGPRIWTDDTILPKQNDDPDRNRTIQARLWVYIGGPLKDPPLVVYDYSINRSSKWPIEKLKDFAGYKHADGYRGYKVLHETGNIKFVACWAHARRKFFEASLLTEHAGKAQIMLDYIAKLYEVETHCKIMTDKKRKQYRSRYAKPILKQIKAWADYEVHRVLPKSQLGKAIQYLLNHWHGLIRYLDAGHLTPDNSKAEQHIRPIALGRKNYLFVGSDRGGRAAAIFYSLVESCKNVGVNPYGYLVDVLTRIPECESDEKLNKLVPGNWVGNGSER